MSVESLAAVLHHSRAKGTAKLVLVGIANHDGDGGAWPMVSTLARYANVTERNVQKSLEKLVSIGELVIHVQDGGSRHTRADHRPNRYDVIVTCPPWCDRTTQHRDTRQTRQANLTGLRGVASVTPLGSRGVASDVHGVSHATPEPSLEPTPPQTPPPPMSPEAQSALIKATLAEAHERMNRE